MSIIRYFIRRTDRWRAFLNIQYNKKDLRLKFKAEHILEPEECRFRESNRRKLYYILIKI